MIRASLLEDCSRQMNRGSVLENRFYEWSGV